MWKPSKHGSEYLTEKPHVVGDYLDDDERFFIATQGTFSLSESYKLDDVAVITFEKPPFLFLYGTFLSLCVVGSWLCMTHRLPSKFEKNFRLRGMAIQV